MSQIADFFLIISPRRKKISINNNMVTYLSVKYRKVGGKTMADPSSEISKASYLEENLLSHSAKLEH